MILLVVLSIIVLGAGVGLQTIAKVPAGAEDILGLNAEAVSRMEQMRATPWAGMAAKAAELTNTAPGLLINNKRYPCTVTVADAAPENAAVEADYRRIKVTVGSQSFTVFVTHP
jgi:hypothetical protein